MEKIFVSDLYAGQKVISNFAIMRKEVLPFKDISKGSYLSMTFGDRSGRIEARKWSDIDAIKDKLEIGTIVLVTAIVEDYRGVLQLNLLEIEIVEQSQVDYNDFLASAPRPISTMQDELKEVIKSIQNNDIRLFLEALFSNERFYKKYSFSPAAVQVHHNYLGGLLEHSLEVVEIVKETARLYPRLDQDILIAGAILHDVGKIEEYEYHSVIYFSNKGRLLGHTVIGYEMVESWAKENNLLKPKQRLHLGHLILSHHGEYALGAPVLPQTIEAIILHQADLMSSKIKQVQQVVEQGNDQENEWTNYNRLLERYFYRGFNDSQKDLV